MFEAKLTSGFIIESALSMIHPWSVVTGAEEGNTPSAFNKYINLIHHNYYLQLNITYTKSNLSTKIELTEL